MHLVFNRVRESKVKEWLVTRKAHVFTRVLQLICRYKLIYNTSVLLFLYIVIDSSLNVIVLVNSGRCLYFILKAALGTGYSMIDTWRWNCPYVF